MTDRLGRDHATLGAELELRARARSVITNGEASARVGRSTAGLMQMLDAIRAENRAQGRPDLACLAVAVRTGLRGGIGREVTIELQAGISKR